MAAPVRRARCSLTSVRSRPRAPGDLTATTSLGHHPASRRPLSVSRTLRFPPPLACAPRAVRLRSRRETAFRTRIEREIRSALSLELSPRIPRAIFPPLAALVVFTCLATVLFLHFCTGRACACARASEPPLSSFFFRTHTRVSRVRAKR